MVTKYSLKLADPQALSHGELPPMLGLSAGSGACSAIVCAFSDELAKSRNAKTNVVPVIESAFFISSGSFGLLHVRCQIWGLNNDDKQICYLIHA